MEQPVAVKYRNAYLRERPAHAPHDEFSIRHPKMTLAQRAKIFSPFAALRGFEEAIDSKLERYVDKVELSEEEQARVNRVLQTLVERMRAGEGPIEVTVVYYVPCGDENHEAFGRRGQYATLTGTLRQIDPLLRRTLRVDETVVEFSDVADIRAESGGG